MAIIKKLFFSPVKSLSFQNTSECEIIKNVGIKNDRLIAFTRNADLKTAKILEQNSVSRNHKDFLSLFPSLCSKAKTPERGLSYSAPKDEVERFTSRIKSIFSIPTGPPALP